MTNPMKNYTMFSDLSPQQKEDYVGGAVVSVGLSHQAKGWVVQVTKDGDPIILFAKTLHTAKQCAETYKLLPDEERIVIPGVTKPAAPVQYEYATGHQIWQDDDDVYFHPKYREPDEETAISEAKKSQKNGDNLVAMRIPVVDWELIGIIE